MRVLVTGASGFIGRAVVAELAEAGHETVAAVRRPGSAPERADIEVVVDLSDLTARTQLETALRGVDGVCHLAALARVRESITNPLPVWQVNTGATFALLGAMVATGCPRLVLMSTAAVYALVDGEPADEEAPERPITPYAMSKLAADHAVASVAPTGALGAVSLRAMTVAGAADGHPDADESRLVPKIMAVQAGRGGSLTVNGDGSARRELVHATDVASAVRLALEACEPGRWRVYNVGSGDAVSVSEVIAAAEEITGRPLPREHRPAAAEPAFLRTDSSRIRRELGWSSPRSELTTILTDAWRAAGR